MSFFVKEPPAVVETAADGFPCEKGVLVLNYQTEESVLGLICCEELIQVFLV